MNYLSIQTLLRGPVPDVGFLLTVMSLLVFGWIMVYSSSAIHAETRYQDQFFFLKRQVVWSLIGLVAFMIAGNVPLRFWQAHAKMWYVLTVIALAMVLIAGPSIAGAKRWIRIGSFSCQPSEFAKVAMIFVVADYMDRRQSRLKDFKKGLVPLLLLVGALFLLIVVEPDLGTPMLLGAVFLSLLILGGAQWRHLFFMAACSLPLVVFAVVRVAYRLKRLLAYLDPWADAQGKGYQLIQSLLAIGSGGFIGKGLGGSQIKISSLPDAHTDFVFSVVGEELGLIGTLGCIGLFLFLCMRGLRISMAAQTTFGRLTAAGISLTIGLQALINMGVASGLFPTKGMTLPFISFGGSSLVITLFSAGILLNISRMEEGPKKSS